MLTDQPLSTGDVAKLCHVAPRLVQQWADRGLLASYRVPGSRHRRFERAAVRRLMNDHGIPDAALCSPVVAWVGRPAVEVVGFDSVYADSPLGVGFAVAGRAIAAVVVDGNGLGQGDSLSVGRHLAAMPDPPLLIGVTTEDCTDGAAWSESGFGVVVVPPVADAALVAILRRGLAQLRRDPAVLAMAAECGVDTSGAGA